MNENIWLQNVNCKICGKEYKIPTSKIKPHWITTLQGYEKRQQKALKNFYIECETEGCEAHNEIMLEDVPKELWDAIKNKQGKG
jgi:hypothetical protein